MKMHAEETELASIDDADGKPVALLFAKDLTTPLFDAA